MTAHAEILEHHPDSLRGPFTAAVALHAGIIGGAVLLAWLNGRADPFGDKNAGGSAVGIEAVNAIPLPRRQAEPNPVANDTKSEVQQQPSKQEKVKKEPEPKDAVALKTKVKELKKAPTQIAEAPRYKPFEEIDPNKVYSKQGAAMSSPMYSMPGAGQIGIGQNTTLGTRFGPYASLIRERVAQKWHPGEVDAHIKTAPPVTARFEIMQDGSVKGNSVNIVTGSGNSVLDFSVRRAIVEAGPFPPLPPGYDKSSATVEFTFELNR